MNVTPGRHQVLKVLVRSNKCASWWFYNEMKSPKSGMRPQDKQESWNFTPKEPIKFISDRTILYGGHNYVDKLNWFTSWPAIGWQTTNQRPPIRRLQIDSHLNNYTYYCHYRIRVNAYYYKRFADLQVSDRHL